MRDNRQVKPFLRWAGGKTRLVRHLLQFVPDGYDESTYWEPFLGSGAMFFALKPQRAVLSDLNEHLIHCHKTVRDKLECTPMVGQIGLE